MQTRIWIAWGFLTLGCATPPEGDGPRRHETVAIRHVAADALAAELVQQLGLRGSEGIAVTVDPRTNSLVVAWGVEAEARATAVLERVQHLDDAQRRAWLSEGTVCGRPLAGERVPLQHANAVELARYLDDLLEQMGMPCRSRYMGGNNGCALPRRGAEGEVFAEKGDERRSRTVVRADPQTNSILLSDLDPQSRVPLLELIARLDVPPPGPP